MIHLDNVKCTGTESDLFKCDHNGIGQTNCFHSKDAGVICKEKSKQENCTINLLGAIRSIHVTLEISGDM